MIPMSLGKYLIFRSWSPWSPDNQSRNKIDKINMFSCDHCKYQIASSKIMDIHNRTFHNNHSNVNTIVKSVATLPVRGRSYTSTIKPMWDILVRTMVSPLIGKKKLQSQLISHGEARSFQCKVCKKTYKHASTLTKHTNSHGVNYPCNKCNKKYIYQDQLKRHKALTHEEGHIKMHHCEYCAYKSFRADVLRNHMSAKHPHA